MFSEQWQFGLLDGWSIGEDGVLFLVLCPNLLGSILRLKTNNGGFLFCPSGIPILGGKVFIITGLKKGHNNGCDSAISLRVCRSVSQGLKKSPKK